MKFFTSATAIVFFTIIKVVSFAQYLPDRYEQKNIGTNEITHELIKARQFVFNKTIAYIYVDATTNRVILQLKPDHKNGGSSYNLGCMALFDLKAGNLKWSNKMTQKEYYTNQTGNYMVHAIVHGENTAYFLCDVSTGKDYLKLKNKVFWLDSVTQMGFGFLPHVPNTPDTLVGVNLKNGNIVWSRKFITDDPIMRTFSLNDSVTIIASSGLHAFNLRTGYGWDYNTVTVDEDYRNTAPQDTEKVEQIPAADATKRFWDPRGRLHDISSLPLKDSCCLYLASKERISKIDKANGNTIWSYEFKNESAGMSWLFLKDTAVYMVSYGRAIRNDESRNYGLPFIAAFNKENGQKIFLNQLENNRESIKRAKQLGNALCLIYKKKLAIYNLSDGSLIKEDTIPERLRDQGVFNSANKLFVNHGNLQMPDFKSIDSAKIGIITRDHRFLEYNKNLTISDSFSDSVLYELKGEKNGFKIISAIIGKQMFVLDTTNKVVARFEAPNNSKLTGNYLIGYEEDKLIETDLAGVLR